MIFKKILEKFLNSRAVRKIRKIFKFWGLKKKFKKFQEPEKILLLIKKLRKKILINPEAQKSLKKF